MLNTPHQCIRNIRLDRVTQKPYARSDDKPVGKGRTTAPAALRLPDHHRAPVIETLRVRHRPTLNRRHPLANLVTAAVSAGVVLGVDKTAHAAAR